MGSHTCICREKVKIFKLLDKRIGRTKPRQREKRLAFASVPFVASLNRQLKRAFLDNDVDFHSKPGPKLGNILCSSNKLRPNKFDQKGVYLQTCSCNDDAKYVGQTRVNFRTRMGQHQADVSFTKSDENISGISKHARHCQDGTINWDEATILTTYNDNNKGSLQQNLLIQESLEIRRLKTSCGKGLNDPQLCVRSNAWDPILAKLKD